MIQEHGKTSGTWKDFRNKEIFQEHGNTSETRKYL